LESLGIRWDHYQIIQFYMAVGGVPAYLQEVQRGETVTQTIDRMFFDPDGLMRTEFDNLYAALFATHQNHIEVIKTLAKRWQGMTRQEIIAHSNLHDGGGLTQVLTELEASSFIMRFPHFSKRDKDFVVYRLSDEYSL
jgi:hypothetical protein